VTLALEPELAPGSDRSHRLTLTLALEEEYAAGEASIDASLNDRRTGSRTDLRQRFDKIETEIAPIPRVVATDIFFEA
jgi:gamma-glutamyl:cysteine ligase YbdK (ATP-grasp superfamily)